MNAAFGPDDLRRRIGHAAGALGQRVLSDPVVGPLAMTALSDLMRLAASNPELAKLVTHTVGAVLNATPTESPADPAPSRPAAQAPLDLESLEDLLVRRLGGLADAVTRRLEGQGSDAELAAELAGAREALRWATS